MAAALAYSDDLLGEAIASSKTWRSVCLALGYIKHPGGKVINRIRTRAVAADIDFSHLERSLWSVPTEKECTGCRRTKTLTDFGIKRSTRDGRQTKCTDCQRALMRTHYEGNIAYYVDKASRSNAVGIARNRAWVIEHFNANPCVDCGMKDVRCLQFDHVRGEKVNNISNMVQGPSSLEVLMSEVAKCDVRCANCHQIKTGAEFGWWHSEIGPELPAPVSPRATDASKG